MKEADSIYVLDTGSNDNTVEKLKKHNIIVKEEIIQHLKTREIIPKD